MIMHFIDIETTGFNRYSDEILEVGYIRCDVDSKVVGYDTLYFYKPEYEIETKAQEVHGLTRKFLEPYEKDFQKNLAVLYTLMEDAIVVGKNSDGFDIPFIKYFIIKNAPYLGEPYVKKSIDMQKSMVDEFREWYESTYGKSTKKTGKLGELIQMIGMSDEEVRDSFRKEFPDVEREGAHSALYDAYMTLLLFRHKVKKARTEGR